MFFSEKTQEVVNRFYRDIKSNLSDFIVDNNYTIESMNITVSDSIDSWLMNNYTYKIEFHRDHKGDLEQIKVYAQLESELNNLYRILSQSHNFMGMRISQAVRYNDYIWVKP